MISAAESPFAATAMQSNRYGRSLKVIAPDSNRLSWVTRHRDLSSRGQRRYFSRLAEALAQNW